MSYEKFCTGCGKTFPAQADSCPHCGAACPNENPGGTLPAGLYLAERYVIGRVVEVDGEGILYEAIDQTSGLPVVIKEYLPVTLCSKRDEEGAVVVKAGSEVPYKTTLVDFVDLYKNLMQLRQKRGLCRVDALFKANNTVYAVMQYQKSLTLTDWLNRQTELLPFERCYSLLEPIFAGLSAMHAAGLVHRGVCPDNIRITPEGSAFLVGYGTLALRSLNSELKPSLYEGYSAPEQYSTTEFQGPYTDVYSLAAVFYKLLAGTAPVAGAGRGDGCPTLRQIGAQVTSAVSKAVDHAMWGNVEQRTQTVALFAEELTGGARAHGSRPRGGDEMDATRVVGAVPSPSPKRRGSGGLSDLTENKPLLIGGCIALGLVVVMLIWFLIRGMVPVSNSSSDLSSSGTDSSSSSSSLSSSSQSSSASKVETVPNFKGELYSDLQANSEYQEKYIFNVTESYSNNVEAGKVISQTPLAGEELPSDHKIDLVVSKGPQYVTVPNYLNYTSGDVLSVLTAAGIKRENIKFVEVVNDGTQTPGQSVDGDRKPGSTMNPETDTITVYMAGALPTPTPTPTPKPTPVPTTSVSLDSNQEQGE